MLIYAPAEELTDMEKNMTIILPDNVKYIINRLMQDGSEAYAVGGCVRDSILGRVPGDWDITTSALPEHTKSLFPRTVDTGIKHGTVTVMMGKTGYEVTTYRVDGKYSDSRHPDSVSFTRSLEEDLKRRDFTINAMAYNSTKGLVDLFGGITDLDNRIIRCVGEPEERFKEDALRILRAVRFSAQLGFKIDPATSHAAGELAHTLVNISAERIHAELDKLILSPHPDRLSVIHDLGLDRYIFPEFCSLADNDPAATVRLLKLLSHAPYDLRLRWAMILKYTGHAVDILRRLKSDNYTIDTVTRLIRFSEVPATITDDYGMRALMRDAGSENIPLLLEFVTALDPHTDLSEAAAIYGGICTRGEATSLRELALNGRDLIAIGIPAGKDLGETLDRLLNEVIRDPSLNTPEALKRLL